MKPDAKRVEHMICPRCGEVLPLDRDDNNMTVLPDCPCGRRACLGDLLTQMKPAPSAPPPASKEHP